MSPREPTEYTQASSQIHTLSNLGARVATAAVLVPVLVLAIAWQSPLGVWAIAYFAMVLGLLEYFGMTARHPVERLFGVGLGAVHGAALYWLSPYVPALGEIAAAVVVVLTFSFFLFGGRGSELRDRLGRVGNTVLGLFYVGLLGTIALLKRDLGTRGGAWVFLLLSVVWAGDTLAYAAGRALGRHKLYAAVSPGKTWEGAVGGLVGSIGAAALAHLWYLPELGWGDVFAVAVPASALGQVGDLCESMLKRACGAKDSGRLLPGHGGMLDRIDALLFAAPYVYYYARFVFAGK